MTVFTCIFCDSYFLLGRWLSGWVICLPCCAKTLMRVSKQVRSYTAVEQSIFLHQLLCLCMSPCRGHHSNGPKFQYKSSINDGNNIILYPTTVQLFMRECSHATFVCVVIPVAVFSVVAVSLAAHPH